MSNKELPTPARLNEPLQKRPESPGRDYEFTRLENHGLMLVILRKLVSRARGLSLSPWLRRWTAYLSDRMTGLLYKGIDYKPLGGLLRQASVEPSERLSTHSAPRAIRLGKLISQALSRTVCFGLSGVSVLINFVSQVFRLGMTP